MRRAEWQATATGVAAQSSRATGRGAHAPLPEWLAGALGEEAWPLWQSLCGEVSSVHGAEPARVLERLASPLHPLEQGVWNLTLLETVLREAAPLSQRVLEGAVSALVADGATVRAKRGWHRRARALRHLQATGLRRLLRCGAFWELPVRARAIVAGAIADRPWRGAVDCVEAVLENALLYLEGAEVREVLAQPFTTKGQGHLQTVADDLARIARTPRPALCALECLLEWRRRASPVVAPRRLGAELTAALEGTLARLAPAFRNLEPERKASLSRVVAAAGGVLSPGGLLAVASLWDVSRGAAIASAPDAEAPPPALAMLFDSAAGMEAAAVVRGPRGGRRAVTGAVLRDRYAAVWEGAEAGRDLVGAVIASCLVVRAGIAAWRRGALSAHARRVDIALARLRALAALVAGLPMTGPCVLLSLDEARLRYAEGGGRAATAAGRLAYEAEVDHLHGLLARMTPVQRRGVRLALGAVGRAVLRVDGWSDAGVVLSRLAGATPTLRRALRRYCARLSVSPLAAAAASAPPAGRGGGADRVDRADRPGAAVQARRDGWDAAFEQLPSSSAQLPGGGREESGELPERVSLPLVAGPLEVGCLEILRWLRDGRSVPALAGVRAAERHGLRSAAESLHEAGRADTASAVFEVAAGLAPGDGAFRAAIGRYYLERGALCSALGWIRDAVELSPADPGFCQLRAETLYQMGALEAARSAALRAATLDHQGQPGSVFQLQDLLADIHAEQQI